MSWSTTKQPANVEVTQNMEDQINQINPAQAAHHLENLDKHVAVHTEIFDISANALGDDLPANYWMHWKFIGTIIGLVLSNNCAPLPYTFSANALPAIDAALGPSDNLLWISLAYIVAVAVCMLIIGRLSDIFGRRWFVISASLSMCLGCIIAGTAKSINTIVGGMVFTGIGAAVGLSFPMVIGELVPKKHRPIWIGTIFFSSFVPLGFGPVITQTLVTETAASWRWCFYIGVIVSGTASIILFVCYWPPNYDMLHVRRSRWEQLKRQDYLGIVLFTGGLLLFLMGLSWGGQKYPWDSAHVIATIVVGFCTLVVFVVYEMYYKGDKLLPTHLFKAPGYVPMVVCASVGTCVAYSMAVLWPQEVNFLLRGGLIRHGLLTGVLASTTQLGFLFGGIGLHYIPWHRAILVCSCVVLTVMCGAMAAMQPGDEALGCSLMAFAGFSIGVIETASRTLLPLTCPDEDIGAAIGVLGLVGYASASVATAIYSTILSNKVKNIVPHQAEVAAIQAGLPKSSLPIFLELYSTNITSVPGMNDNIIVSVSRGVAQGYADSFRYVWYAVIAFGTLATVSSLFIHNYEKYLTDKVARKLRFQGTKNELSGEDEKAV